MQPGTDKARNMRRAAGLPGQAPKNLELVSGVAPTPAEDLRYHGGKTIAKLSFVNLYVAGESWPAQDVEAIERALAAAMADRNLNNVMAQYFTEPIGSTARNWHPLNGGYKPQVVTQGDVQYYLKFLHDQGYLKGYDLPNTVFNFMLPPGTVLTTNSGRSSADGGVPASDVVTADKEDDGDEPDSPIPEAEEGNSRDGLGGFHGSIHLGKTTLYYAVGAYSEKRADGFRNGIPVFPEAWKNIVATFYHELQEARTDPDVEDAIRAGNDPRGVQFLGWTSDRGEECGDYPLDEVRQLGTIIKEVPLTDGSGVVPVQFQYSNYVHGPEGPIASPHPPLRR